MSTDRDITLAVGYKIPYKQLEKLFSEEQDDDVRWLKGYKAIGATLEDVEDGAEDATFKNPITGKDEHVDLTSVDDFMHALSQVFPCDALAYGDYDIDGYVIGPDFDSQERQIGGGMFVNYADLSRKQIKELFDKCKVIRVKLQALGLKPGRAKVTMVVKVD